MGSTPQKLYKIKYKNVDLNFIGFLVWKKKVFSYNVSYTVPICIHLHLCFYEGNSRHILFRRWVMSSFDALSVCYQNEVIYVSIKMFYVCVKCATSFMSYLKLSISEANHFQTFNDIKSQFLNKNIHQNFLKWMSLFGLGYLNKNLEQH